MLPVCPFGLAQGKKEEGTGGGQAPRRRSLASSRCGWRPLRLIRCKPSQFMFHHPTVQTRGPCRPLPSDAGPHPTISRVPAAVETGPSFSCLHCTTHRHSWYTIRCGSLHTLFGGELETLGAGPTHTFSGYPPSTSSLGATRTQTHVDPTLHCRLFCHLLGPLLRRYSGGPAAFEAGMRGRVLEHRRQTCHHPGWAVRGRHPDTHCRPVPCSACLACLAGSHQSPVGQETE